MQQYLSELNAIANNVFDTNGAHLDSLYTKVIEGKERGFDFVTIEPSINHIDQNNISIEKRILFEHCAYLIKLRNEARNNNLQFSINIEEDIKKTLRLLYANQRSDQYFGPVEGKNSIYYIYTDSVVDFIVDKALNHHLEFLLYDQKVTAQNFMKAWLSFIRENPITNSIYESNKDLTDYVLGNTKGNIEIQQNSGTLYSYLKREMGIELQPYREDKFADVCIYSAAEFSNVFSLQYESEKRKDILDDKHKKWFKDCLITIEHENNYLDAFTEMMYLTYRRARLKVLITYYDGDNLENTRTVFETMSSNFKNIINQANSVFAENTRTEYFFILGSKLKNTENIIWNMQSFSYSGQFKNSIVN